MDGAGGPFWQWRSGGGKAGGTTAEGDAGGAGLVRFTWLDGFVGGWGGVEVAEFGGGGKKARVAVLEEVGERMLGAE